MIVITGPTGGIGRLVLSTLLHGSEPVRVVARTPDKLRDDVRERVDVIEGSHSDPDVIAEALVGARALFWLVASDRTAASPYHSYVGFSLPVAAALPSSDVQRVVTVSALGRQVQRYTGYASASRAMDGLLRSTGVHLRAPLAPSLMDNLLRGGEALRAEGVVRDTAPADVQAPMVARRDVAAVAAALLIDDTWTGQEDVPVLGPQDVSFNDVARILTEVLKHPVRYERCSLQDSERALRGIGFTPPWPKGWSR